jgi:Zn-dependent protease with chaperone function
MRISFEDRCDWRFGVLTSRQKSRFKLMDLQAGDLQPLPYHCALRNYLNAHERELWKWMSSTQAKLNYTENLRLELLKSTYRLDPGNHEALYRSVEEARARLGLAIPVTAYQSQHTPTPNAALYYIPGEGHIVFSGPLMSLLSPAELTAVIGHELAHYLLWQHDNGDYLIADRLLQTVLHDGRAAPSHVQSARWFQLYTEIYCDRGALLAAGDANAAISGLVKLETGIPEVSAASYLKQADEIFQNSKVSTEQLTHPEAFIRARALALWVEKRDNATPDIAAMVEGSPCLDDYDLLRQAKLTADTRVTLEKLLAPKWFQTDPVLGHAKMFFADFKPRQEGAGSFETDADDLAARAADDKQLRNYLCYLLLDFVVADPELNDTPLAAALQFSNRLGIESDFERVASKDLKLKARDLARIKKEAAELLAKVEATS